VDDRIGKTVLVGLTYLDANGEVRERMQIFGPIVSIGEGVVAIGTDDEGGSFTIPYDDDTLQPAKPGVYRCKNPVMEVENPDFLSAWTIKPPHDDDEPVE
jgi:hypothetical protein